MKNRCSSRLDRAGRSRKRRFLFLFIARDTQSRKYTARAALILQLRIRSTSSFLFALKSRARPSRCNPLGSIRSRSSLRERQYGIACCCELRPSVRICSSLEIKFILTVIRLFNYLLIVSTYIIRTIPEKAVFIVPLPLKEINIILSIFCHADTQGISSVLSIKILGNTIELKQRNKSDKELNAGSSNLHANSVSVI